MDSGHQHTEIQKLTLDKSVLKSFPDHRGGRPRAFHDAKLEKVSAFIPAADAHRLRVLAAERQQTLGQVLADLIHSVGEKTTPLTTTNGVIESELQKVVEHFSKLPEELIMAAVEVMLPGRVKKRTGPPKGRKFKPHQAGPWNTQKLHEEMQRLNLTLRALADRFNPPLSDVAVHKWFKNGIPDSRQAELTEIFNTFNLDALK